MPLNTQQRSKNLELTQYPCSRLKGIGPQILAKLERLGIHSVQDLLLHLPLKYEDRSKITPISALKAHQHALIEGIIVHTEKTRTKRPQLICQLADESGSRLLLRFFHFNYLKGLTIGQTLRCYGEVRWGSQGMELIHPEYEVISPPHSSFSQPSHLLMEEHLSPIYPSSEGLSQRLWKKITDQALALLTKENDAILIDDSPISEALLYLHRPPTHESSEALLNPEHPMRQRLIFEELLAHQLSLRYVREEARRHQAIAFKHSLNLVNAFKSILPFSLTSAQERVCKTILDDLAETKPMMRLVQGDVGSGKTVVAAIAAVRVIDANQQAAFMVPTEILAEQHYHHLNRWFEELNLKQPKKIQVGLLQGKTKTSERRVLLEKLKSGELNLLIGTHALFQQDVDFHSLSLIIIDEQHRFGVHQRLALRNKGSSNNYLPHQLIMTATPIPRTLAMCAYADLDYSVIDELPPGRKPIKTIVIDNSRRNEIIERIATLCKKGQQVYWVCTLIEESEILQAEAATERFSELVEKLHFLKIGLIHGRLSAQEKEHIMMEFKDGQIQLLVATTVIEVGVDVPKASLMIIENAERLGLAQLHQLRGRVGRGSIESHCVLLYQPPLSQTAQQRLQTLRESQDGFYIAEQDLKLRGPGQFLGTRQTGDMSFKIADLVRDKDQLPKVQELAIYLLNNEPERAQAIYQRWLAPVRDYSQV